MSISATIRGMSVSFWHDDTNVTPCESNQVLDFGNRSLDCEETYSLKLVNHTSIRSNVKCWFEHFNCFLSSSNTSKNRRIGHEFDKYLGDSILQKRQEHDMKR